MSDGLDTRLRAVELEAASATQQISNHEMICAERYTTISTSHGEMRRAIGSIHSLLTKVGLMMLAGMGGILVKLVFFP